MRRGLGGPQPKNVAGRKAFGVPGAPPLTDEHLEKMQIGAPYMYHCSCGANYVGVEHWLNGGCPEIPTPFATKVVRDYEADRRHSSDVLTTSGVTGCPRATGFSNLRASPVMMDKMVSMYTGTALHEMLQREGAAVGQITEACTCGELPSAEKVQLLGGEEHHPRCGRSLCTFTATFPFGGETVTMSGRVDAIEGLDARTVDEASKIALVDYKLRNPNARKFAEKTDDWVQANFNLMLAAIAMEDPEHPLHGKEVVAAVVYTNYFYEWGLPKVFQTPTPQEMQGRMGQSLHAGPEGYTIKDLIALHLKSLRLKSVKEVIEEIPAIGAKQFGGKKCSQYCQYAPLCGVYVPDDF